MTTENNFQPNLNYIEDICFTSKSSYRIFKNSEKVFLSVYRTNVELTSDGWVDFKKNIVDNQSELNKEYELILSEQKEVDSILNKQSIPFNPEDFTRGDSFCLAYNEKECFILESFKRDINEIYTIQIENKTGDTYICKGGEALLIRKNTKAESHNIDKTEVINEWLAWCIKPENVETRKDYLLNKWSSGMLQIFFEEYTIRIALTEFRLCLLKKGEESYTQLYLTEEEFEMLEIVFCTGLDATEWLKQKNDYLLKRNSNSVMDFTEKHLFEFEIFSLRYLNSEERIREVTKIANRCSKEVLKSDLEKMLEEVKAKDYNGSVDFKSKKIAEITEVIDIVDKLVLNKVNVNQQKLPLRKQKTEIGTQIEGLEAEKVLWINCSKTQRGVERINMLIDTLNGVYDNSVPEKNEETYYIAKNWLDGYIEMPLFDIEQAQRLIATINSL